MRLELFPGERCAPQENRTDVRPKSELTYE